jgi:hypothetical protein
MKLLPAKVDVSLLKRVDDVSFDGSFLGNVQHHWHGMLRWPCTAASWV